MATGKQKSGERFFNNGCLEITSKQLIVTFIFSLLLFSIEYTGPTEENNSEQFPCMDLFLKVHPGLHDLQCPSTYAV